MYSAYDRLNQVHIDTYNLPATNCTCVLIFLFPNCTIISLSTWSSYSLCKNSTNELVIKSVCVKHQLNYTFISYMLLILLHVHDANNQNILARYIAGCPGKPRISVVRKMKDMSLIWTTRDICVVCHHTNRMRKKNCYTKNKQSSCEQQWYQGHSRKETWDKHGIKQCCAFILTTKRVVKGTSILHITREVLGW
jgi:hypothetical protein